MPLFLSDLDETWILSTDFRKIIKHQISWIFVQWEPSWSMRTDVQTDRQAYAISRFFAIMQTRLNIFLVLPTSLIPDCDCYVDVSFASHHSWTENPQATVRERTRQNCYSRHTFSYFVKLKQAANINIQSGTAQLFISCLKLFSVHLDHYQKVQYKTLKSGPTEVLGTWLYINGVCIRTKFQIVFRF